MSLGQNSEVRVNRQMGSAAPIAELPNHPSLHIQHPARRRGEATGGFRAQKFTLVGLLGEFTGNIGTVIDPAAALAAVVGAAVPGMAVKDGHRPGGRFDVDLLRVAIFEIGQLVFGMAGPAMAARHIFRHKTRKEPFRTRLALIIVFQLAAATVGTLALHGHLDVLASVF